MQSMQCMRTSTGCSLLRKQTGRGLSLWACIQLVRTRSHPHNVHLLGAVLAEHTMGKSQNESCSELHVEDSCTSQTQISLTLSTHESVVPRIPEGSLIRAGSGQISNLGHVHGGQASPQPSEDLSTQVIHKKIRAIIRFVPVTCNTGSHVWSACRLPKKHGVNQGQTWSRLASEPSKQTQCP